MADQNEAVALLTAEDARGIATTDQDLGFATCPKVAAIADGRAVVVSAAELAAKDQQIADLTKAAECSAAAHAGMVAVADALRAENEALRKDAERYRLVRSQEGVSISMTYDGNTGSTTWMQGEEIDQWCDAARSQS